MMHKKYTLWQRFVMAIRDVREMATCSMQCPGCGSGNVTGSGNSWICHNCGAMWQSS
jgi:transposase-like protein